MKNLKPAFNYPVLRMIVMALFNQGLELKRPGLTFAHGNVGNQFIDNAKFFDDFLADLEPTDHIVMMRKSTVEGEERYLAQRCEMVEKAHQELRDITAALGLSIGHGKDLVEVIKGLRVSLAEANVNLELAKQKRKKKAK